MSFKRVFGVLVVTLGLFYLGLGLHTKSVTFAQNAGRDSRPVDTPVEPTPSENVRAFRARLSTLAETNDLDGVDDLLNEVDAVLPDLARPITWWEDIESCGFYPQESLLACVINIKQRSGYGGPVGGIGSLEHVEFCVDRGNNRWQRIDSVGISHVHVHDELNRVEPPWKYVVYTKINPYGGLRTTLDGRTAKTQTRGPTLRARFTLSWLVPPAGCNDVPVFGDIYEAQIRYDPAR